MRSFFKFFTAFLALTGAVALLSRSFGVSFGRSDYWDHHGFLFLFFVTCFPRLTLLLATVPTGGLLWWLALIFSPRILVACMATLAYWSQNPILVIIAWLVALSGESSEKFVIVNRSRARWNGKKGFESAKWVDVEVKNKEG